MTDGDVEQPAKRVQFNFRVHEVALEMVDALGDRAGGGFDRSTIVRVILAEGLRDEGFKSRVVGKLRARRAATS